MNKHTQSTTKLPWPCGRSLNTLQECSAWATQVSRLIPRWDGPVHFTVLDHAFFSAQNILISEPWPYICLSVTSLQFVSFSLVK